MSSAAPASSSRFAWQTYLVRRKVLKLFGGTFHIYDPNGQVVFYSKMKAFKLKEDIRLYTGEDMNTEVLVIKARRALDISSHYDVVDSVSGVKVGVLRRKGLKSLVRDEWLLMDATDREIGLIQEDSAGLALLRRFLTNLVPQRYHVNVGQSLVCNLKQHFNPFVLKLDVDFTPDVQGLLDRRLGIAAAVLLCAVEGRQE